MAFSKKCDRCGDFYDCYPEDRYGQDICVNGVLPVSISNEEKSKYYHFDLIDLCPDCMKEFADWINIKRKIIPDDADFYKILDEREKKRIEAMASIFDPTETVVVPSETIPAQRTVLSERKIKKHDK